VDILLSILPPFPIFIQSLKLPHSPQSSTSSFNGMSLISNWVWSPFDPVVLILLLSCSWVISCFSPIVEELQKADRFRLFSTASSTYFFTHFPSVPGHSLVGCRPGRPRITRGKGIGISGWRNASKNTVKSHSAIKHLLANASRNGYPECSTEYPKLCQCGVSDT